MKVWAWVWVCSLAVVGPVPALLVAYAVALALALGNPGIGPVVFGLTYFGLLAFALLMLKQVRRAFGLTGREGRGLIWAGGGVLVALWCAVFGAFAIQAGWTSLA